MRLATADMLYLIKKNKLDNEDPDDCSNDDGGDEH